MKRKQCESAPLSSAPPYPKSHLFFDFIRLHHISQSLKEENRNTGFRENLLAVQLFQPKISHGSALDRKLASMVKDWRLTA
jgi:hypothetical protein